MSATVMIGGLNTASPRTRARLTGVVYLLFFVAAILGSVVAPGISGPGATGDAAATASNRVREAFNYMGEGHAQGKIIINV